MGSSILGYGAEDVERIRYAKEMSDVYLNAYLPHPEEWAERFLRVFLWSKQKEILRSVFENRRTTVAAGYDVGKTFIAAVATLAFLFLKPNSKVITTAPTYKQVKTLLWSEINTLFKGKLQAGQFIFPGTCLQTELKIQDNWWALGISPRDPVNAQGFHAEHILVIADESPGVSAEIMDALEGAMGSEDAHMLQIGNPIKQGDHFHKSYNADNVNEIKISVFDSPNFTGEPVPDEVAASLVSPVWQKERLDDWGEDHPLYISKVMAEFPALSDKQLISYLMCQEAIYRDVVPEGKKSLGVDIARFGTNLTAYTKRQGLAIEKPMTEAKRDNVQVAARIKSMFNTDPDLETVIIDEGGPGGGVVDILRADKKEGAFAGNIIALQFGGGALDPKQYANMRSQLWFDMRDFLKTGRIPNDDKLIGDLTAPEYDVNRRGQLILEPKEQTEARIGRSPDRGDSACCSVHNPRRAMYKMITSSESYSTDDLLREMGIE